jgi:hypothetical protein
MGDKTEIVVKETECLLHSSDSKEYSPMVGPSEHSSVDFWLHKKKRF